MPPPPRRHAPEDPSPAPPATGARLGMALLGYMAGITLIITLLPFRFDWPTRWRVMFTGGPEDLAANVLLFVPLGFLFQLARSERGTHSALGVLWAGALASMAIEALQLFERTRYTSPLDVATNAAGAWLGAWGYARLGVRRRLDGEQVGRLLLELPLMGLAYLLVPLLWLDALATVAVPDRLMLAPLLGTVGGMVLGGLQRRHFGPVRGMRAGVTAAVAAAGFLAGCVPAIGTRPATIGVGVVLTGALTWAIGQWRRATVATDRRFEVPLLRAIAPVYALYLACAVAGPVVLTPGEWRAGLGFPGAAATWTKGAILQVLELVAAYTLLGFMVAEYRGRAVERFRASRLRLAAWGTLVALATEGVRGFHAGEGASLARGLLLGTAVVYGGWLYHLQLAHVLRLVAAGRRRAPPPA